MRQNSTYIMFKDGRAAVFAGGKVFRQVSRHTLSLASCERGWTINVYRAGVIILPGCLLQHSTAPIVVIILAPGLDWRVESRLFPLLGSVVFRQLARFEVIPIFLGQVIPENIFMLADSVFLLERFAVQILHSLVTCYAMIYIFKSVYYYDFNFSI